MKRVMLVGVVFLLLAAATAKEPLPQLGTKFHSLPAGTGKEQVEGACLPCHSADILVQQRLTDKHWAANVDKMIRWGAVVADADKPAIVLYLSKNFGPENQFTPSRVRPAR